MGQKELAMNQFRVWLSDDYLMIPKKMLKTSTLSITGRLYLHFLDEMGGGQYMMDDDWNVYLLHGIDELADTFDCSVRWINAGMNKLKRLNLIYTQKEKHNYWKTIDIGDMTCIYLLDNDGNRFKAF